MKRRLHETALTKMRRAFARQQPFTEQPLCALQPSPLHELALVRHQNVASVEGIADKELSALLATDRVIPVAHDTTFEALRDVSPLLGSRNGLDTADDSMEVIATKIAELVHV